MANLHLKKGTLICQIFFSSLIILDILAATNTILPTIKYMLEQEKEQEENQNRTELGPNSLVLAKKELQRQQGVNIALGVAELGALAILIMCNFAGLR